MSQAVEKKQEKYAGRSAVAFTSSVCASSYGCECFAAVMIERLRRGAIHILLTMAFAWGTGMVVNLLT